MTASTTPAQIHPELDLPLLRDLLAEDRPLWTPRELRDLTATVASELTTPLLGVLRFETEQRWWAQLALTSGIELWLLSWLPGQRTELHDHGGAAGALTVVSGTLTERVARVEPDGRAVEVVHEVHVGQSRVFGPHHVHQVSNEGADPAVSVHVYRPARHTMTPYRFDPVHGPLRLD
jgi:mannose-6-phosphate isomerase-like protein (cupin superfamily)